MALNPVMMIPFVLVPVVIVTINYVVFSLGLVHVPVIMQPFTVPLGVSGFFATGGDFRGSLLQFFDLAVSALNILPIFQSLGTHSCRTRRGCCAARGKPAADPGSGPVGTRFIASSSYRCVIGARKEAVSTVVGEPTNLVRCCIVCTFELKNLTPHR